MPWAEDDGYGFSLLGLQADEEIAYALHPCLEFSMTLPTWQYVLYYRRVSNIPCCSSRKWVAWVPTDGNNTSTFVVSNEFIVYTSKRHTIEIFLVVHLYASEIKSHQGRIVAYGFKHITSVLFPFPCHSIEGIILMCHHVTFGLQEAQPLFQLFAAINCLLCHDLLRATCQHQGSHGYHGH